MERDAALYSGALVMQWGGACARFHARWWYPAGTREKEQGKWSGASATAASQFRLFASIPSANACGLLNMKDGLINVCYQNSLWQTFYHTSELKEIVMRQRDDCGEVSATAQWMHDAGRLQQSQGVLAGMRVLFEELELSSAAVVHTHAMQEHLPPRFRSGKQEDTSELRSHVLDCLENALAVTADADALRSVFGGTLATHRVCRTCGNAKKSTESFKEQVLAFPQRYQVRSSFLFSSLHFFCLPTSFVYSSLLFFINTAHHRRRANRCEEGGR